MNRQDIIDRLRENEAALKARGVTHAALFGSRARGEERRDSDIDIMIDIDPGRLSAVGIRRDQALYREPLRGVGGRDRSRGLEAVRSPSR